MVMARPDDLELYCGGTVTRLIGDGKIVMSVKVTSGEMGVESAFCLRIPIICIT